MSESEPSGGGAKGRLVGFVSLGALLVLVGVAFYSSWDTSASKDAAPSTAQASPEGATTPSAGAPSAEDAPVPDITKMPRVGDSLPKRRAKGATVTSVVEDIALSPPARLLAERLRCVCGCPDTLAICTCKKTPGSRDMKKYLQELVTAGKTPAEVESAMVARYGEKVIRQ